MKRTLVVLLSFVVVLSTCGTAGNTNSGAIVDSLVVSDGTTEKVYSVDDLAELPASDSTFNEVTYKGVSLSALLADAGFDAGGLKAVKAVASDGYTINYEPALFQRSDVLVAYATVDGSLTADDGVFRMVLPGEEGKLNLRMLVELQAIP